MNQNETLKVGQGGKNIILKSEEDNIKREKGKPRQNININRLMDRQAYRERNEA